MGEKDVSLILEAWSIKEKLDTTTMRVRTEADFAIFLKLPLLSRLVFLNVFLLLISTILFQLENVPLTFPEG